MHRDALRALAGPSRRVGTCQTQTVWGHPWMGGIEGIIIGSTISPLLVYHPPKRSCYSPCSYTNSHNFIFLAHPLLLDPYRYAFLYVFFLSCSTHTQAIFFVEWRRMVLYTYSQKFAGSWHTDYLLINRTRGAFMVPLILREAAVHQLKNRQM